MRRLRNRHFPYRYRRQPRRSEATTPVVNTENQLSDAALSSTPRTYAPTALLLRAQMAFAVAQTIASPPPPIESACTRAFPPGTSSRLENRYGPLGPSR